jgi:hypothetical protein
MGPTEELEDIRTSQSTPLENLSERLTFPEQVGLNWYSSSVVRFL